MNFWYKHRGKDWDDEDWQPYGEWLASTRTKSRRF
jgi:hypothetical protein